MMHPEAGSGNQESPTSGWALTSVVWGRACLPVADLFLITPTQTVESIGEAELFLRPNRRSGFGEKHRAVPLFIDPGDPNQKSTICTSLNSTIAVLFSSNAKC